MEERIFYPMSYYMDDRLEMVKQMFGTLKPKTIRNLAPEHVRDESIEVIEEFVLNELMCISNKRLRAIINDTHCPPDTETSDNSDSDRKAQHVSLEEISSDSEINEPKTGKGKSDDTTPSVSVTHSTQEILVQEQANVDTSVNIGKENKLHRTFRKKNHNKRPHSPDVISIVPEQVLLVIDSTDDEVASKTKKTIETNKIAFEAEEGEILDGDGLKQLKNQEITCSPNHIEKKQEQSFDNESNQDMNDGLKIKEEVKQEPLNANVTMQKLVLKANENHDACKKYVTDTLKANPLNNSDEDDVISLEGGDIDMIDLNEYTQSTFSSNVSNTMEFGDVISIDSSNDDSNKAIFSWSERYFKSTKVNKTLTASRLNRKVSEKMKATKLGDKLQLKKSEETSEKKGESINERVNEKSISENDGALSHSTKKVSTL